MIPDFTNCLRRELARRQRANPRYSLRAFARFLRIDHSTLSQILRGRRAIPASRLPELSRLLKLGGEEAEVYLAATRQPDPAGVAALMRQQAWLAEADALIRSNAHWQLLQLLEDPEWRPDMRWAAAKTGASVDDLNQAVTRLLRLRLLQIDDRGAWRRTEAVSGLDASGFVEVALARTRGPSGG